MVTGLSSLLGSISDVLKSASPEEEFVSALTDLAKSITEKPLSISIEQHIYSPKELSLSEKTKWLKQLSADLMEL